jgi:outer membrane lipoprotein LolB
VARRALVHPLQSRRAPGRPVEPPPFLALREAGIVAATVCAFVAGCATTPAVAPAPGADGIRAFAVDGRLSARTAEHAVTANFAWTHDPPRDELEVATPLGQTVALLSGNDAERRVLLRLPDGRVDEATDWTTLTSRALGFPLPVTGLASWMVGAPREGAPYSIEPDAVGRAAVLRQDGWEVVYTYADAAARRPARLFLSYPDVEVRVVIDAWRP